MRGWIKLLAASVFLMPGLAFAQCVSLTGGAYTQNFDTLSNTAGSTTNNLTVAGWFMTETGGGARDNEQYAVDTGSSTTGDTYSYGSAASTDRALGGLRSGTLIPVVGACFTNNTGAALSSLDVAYTGEQWRLGTAARTDQINFEFSTNSTDLVTGTWTGVAALNFVTPDTVTTGAKNGNAAADRTAKSSTISSLNIANGATFWIRWTDTDASGADDGLSIDDFSLTAGTVSATPNLSINDVTIVEGNAGTTTATFTVSLSAPAPAGGVTFDIATANNTATTANNDYVAKSLTTQTIPAGSSTYSFDVLVNGDTTLEPNESYFVNITNVVGATVLDGQGSGGITNDDFAITEIHSIQGSGATSPLVGSSVTTRGIVTGLRSNGFFMQTTDADSDANPATSQGIFVFTSVAPTVAAGNLILVTGTVVEFIPSSSNQLALTELTSPVINAVLSSGNALPTSITLTSADANAASPLTSLERYEGMRVTASLTVVAPAAGNINEANATSTGTGVFYGVLPGVGRPFREKGISVLDTFATPVGIDVWDSNPERIRVQSTGFGGVAMNASVGDTLSNISGVLDYGFGAYTLVPYSGQTYTAVTVPTPVSTAEAEEFTVAGFNLLRFFDSVNDPAVSDPVLTTTALNNRLGKTANAICEYVKTPDILGVVEVENLSVLQSLATTINNGQVAGGVPVSSCNSAPNYVPYLVEGNDVGGIDVGFLVSTKIVDGGTTPRVEVLSVTQENKNELLTNPDSSTSLLNDRPTLRLQAIVHHANGASYPVTVLINHLRSLSGVNDTAAGSNGWATNGERIRGKRLKQAESLAALIQARQLANPNEKIMLLGDFNAFEFSDGYVDSMGIITGQETAAGTVVNRSGFVVSTPLTNMTTVSAPADKYSFSFDGSSQSLDHAVVNEALLMDAGIRSEHARLNSDFAEILFGVYTQTVAGVYDVPARVSDHDPVVLYVKPKAFVDVDLGVAVSNPDTTVNAGNTTTFTVDASNLDESVAVDNARVSFVFDAAISGVSITTPSGWTCTAPVVAAASTTIDCSALTFAATAQSSFTVAVPVPLNFPDGDLNLSATISADQSDTASENNISSDFVTVIAQKANLAIRARGPSTINVGLKARINIVVNNYGPDAARNVAVAITTNAPASNFKIAAPAGWTCALDGAYPTARFLCSIAGGSPLAVGNRPEFILTFTAPASMASTNLIIGTGISSDTVDANINNNEDSYSLFINRVRTIGLPSNPSN
jgi:uncharacterized protein